MTKAILKILSLILAFILLVPLMIACGEENPENEQTELQRFEKMSEYEKAFFILTNDINVKKIRSDATANVACKYKGYSLVASLVGFTVEMDDEAEYFLYSEQTLSLTIAGGSQVTLAKQGYADGKEFIYTATNGSGKGYYAESTAEAIKEKRREQLESGPADDFGLNASNCQAACTQNAHGGWVATFTNVGTDSLGEFKKYIDMSFGDILDSSDLMGVTLEVIVSANLKPVSIKLDYIFKDANTKLTVESTFTINDDVELPTVDLTGYTKKSSLGNNSPGVGM